MATVELFEVTAEHIALLRRANVGWEHCEYGAPAIDCKRPYGNGDVEGDVAEILGWTVSADDGLTAEQSIRAAKLHAETEHALAIFLSWGAMEEGTYRKVDWRTWTRVAIPASGGVNSPTVTTKSAVIPASRSIARGSAGND